MEMTGSLCGDRVQKKRSLTFGVLFLILGSLLVVINTQFPSVAEGLYSRGESGILRKIALSDAKEIRPLDYYTGKIEDAWLGPLTSLVSGGLFMLFCLWFLQGADVFKFGAATFLYLLLSRSQVLFYPPYGDALLAVLSEPLWLVRHHLDWIGLLHQKSFYLGGVLQYPGSIYPQFIAILLHFSPSPPFFLLMNHLIVFVAGATLVATLREILMEMVGPQRAMLGALLFLALPIFQCHVELLNMEIVCACFAGLALFMALKKNFFMASAMAVFAAMIKLSGGISAGMLLGVCLLTFFNESNKKKFAADLAWVLGACSIVYYLMILRQSVVGLGGLVSRDSTPAIRSLSAHFIPWLFLFLSVLYFGSFIHGCIVEKKKGGRFIELVNRYYQSAAIFGMVAAWCLSIFLAPCLIPRYTVLAMPFMLLFFVLLFSRTVNKERLFTASMVAMILFALACSHGLIFMHPKVTDSVNANEISLRYRNVLKVYMRAAEEIERDYSGFAVAGDILMAQILVFNEAGYVRRSVKDVFAYGSATTHKEIGNIVGLRKFNIGKVIFIAHTSEDPYHLTSFPIGSEDKIVNEIWSGDNRITFFMGGFSILKWAVAVEKLQRQRVVASSHELLGKP